jgi:polyhydroxyalkanoate synthesis repressor PhaR
MVKNGEIFIVRDAKTGEDITRSVLTQIIFEEEGKGQNLLPINFLRDIIKLYDDSVNKLVPNYLEMSMAAFANQHDEWRKGMDAAVSETFPMHQFEEMGRRNMEIFRQTMSMMNPFLQQPEDGSNLPSNPGAQPDIQSGSKGASPSGGMETNDGIDGLRQQMAAMQEQLEKLARNS